MAEVESKHVDPVHRQDADNCHLEMAGEAIGNGTRAATSDRAGELPAVESTESVTRIWGNLANTSKHKVTDGQRESRLVRMTVFASTMTCQRSKS